MEYLDVVDENNKLTNEVKSRRMVHEKGLWHREIAVWIIKDKNKVLMQKRAANKKLAPNKWALTAGHITAGEAIIKAAIREVKEELGIENIGPSNFKLLYVQKCKYRYKEEQSLINNHFKYIYVFQTDLSESDFVIQKEELSEIKYIELNKLKNIKKTKANLDKYTKGIFSPETKEVIEKIEDFLKEENNYA